MALNAPRTSQHASAGLSLRKPPKPVGGRKTNHVSFISSLKGHKRHSLGRISWPPIILRSSVTHYRLNATLIYQHNKRGTYPSPHSKIQSVRKCYHGLGYRLIFRGFTVWRWVCTVLVMLITLKMTLIKSCTWSPPLTCTCLGKCKFPHVKRIWLLTGTTQKMYRRKSQKGDFPIPLVMVTRKSKKPPLMKARYLWSSLGGLPLVWAAPYRAIPSQCLYSTTQQRRKAQNGGRKY